MDNNKFDMKAIEEEYAEELRLQQELSSGSILDGYLQKASHVASTETTEDERKTTTEVLNAMNEVEKQAVERVNFFEINGVKKEVHIKNCNLQIKWITERKENMYPMTQIEKLAESIKKSTLIQPIMVRKIAKSITSQYVEEDKDICKRGYGYRIVSGHRRFRAYQLLQQREQERIDKLKETNPNYDEVNEYDTINAIIITNIEDSEVKELEKRMYEESNDLMRTNTLFDKMCFFKPWEIDMSNPLTQIEYAKFKFPNDEERQQSFRVKGTMTDLVDFLILQMVSAFKLEEEPSPKTIRNYLDRLNKLTATLRDEVVKGNVLNENECRYLINLSEEEQNAIADLCKEEDAKELVGERIKELKQAEKDLKNAKSKKHSTNSNGEFEELISRPVNSLSEEESELLSQLRQEKLAEKEKAKKKMMESVKVFVEVMNELNKDKPTLKRAFGEVGAVDEIIEDVKFAERLKKEVEKYTTSKEETEE